MPAILSREELVDIYQKGDRGSRIRFGHQVKKLSAESQQWIFKQCGLDPNGKKPAQPVRRKRREHPGSNNGSERVYWSGSEWDTIAEIVFTLRLNDPVPHLSQLVDRAQRQLPPERQRKITGMVQCREVLGRLLKLKKDFDARLQSVPRLQSRVEQLNSAPSREAILSSLGDEEIFRRFKEKIFSLVTPEEVAETFGPHLLLGLIPFEDVAAAAIRGAIGLYQEGRAEFNQFLDTDYGVGSLPAPKVKRKETPRCLIVGGTQEEGARIRTNMKARAQVICISEYTDRVPLDGYHVILVWISRSSKAVRQAIAEKCSAQRVVGHAGGFTWLIKKLDRVLREEGFSK